MPKGKIIKRVTLKDLELGPELVGIDGSPTQVVEINPAQTKSRAQMVIDSGLPAHERIKLIMMGGIKNREGSMKLEGESEKLAQNAGDFILKLLLK